MSTTYSMALVGLVAALVAALAGVLSVLLTRRGNRAAADARNEAASQREATIRPRIEVSNIVPERQESAVGLRYSNPGGAAFPWILFVHVLDKLYLVKQNIGSGEVSVQVSAVGERLSTAAPETLSFLAYRVIASLAVDVDGGVWDLRKGVLIDATVDEALRAAGERVGHRFE